MPRSGTKARKETVRRIYAVRPGHTPQETKERRELGAAIATMWFQLLLPAKTLPAPKLRLLKKSFADFRGRLKNSPTHEVLLLTLQAGTCVTMARQGDRRSVSRLQHALGAANMAVRLAEESARPELKGETLAVRAAAQHTLASLEPEKQRVLLSKALEDLDEAIDVWSDRSTTSVAPIQAEKAQVLRELATTKGTGRDARLAESLKQYQVAVESLVSELGSRASQSSQAAETPTQEVPWIAQIMAIRANYGLTRTEFAPLLGYRERTLASWEAGEKQPPQEVMRRYEELRRLHEGLSSVMRAGSIPMWLKTKNPAFNDRPPLEVLREGQADALWQMIFQLRASPSF